MKSPTHASSECRQGRGVDGQEPTGPNDIGSSAARVRMCCCHSPPADFFLVTMGGAGPTGWPHALAAGFPQPPGGRRQSLNHAALAGCVPAHLSCTSSLRSPKKQQTETGDCWCCGLCPCTVLYPKSPAFSAAGGTAHHKTRQMSYTGTKFTT